MYTLYDVLASTKPGTLCEARGWIFYVGKFVKSRMFFFLQIENEYGSYGNDKAYLRNLVTMARGHLGNDIIL